MSISSRIAVTATLAMGAVAGLTTSGFSEMQALPTALHQMSSALRTQVSQQVLLCDQSAIGNLLNWAAEPLQVKFVPDPSDPPGSSGGTGTR